MKNVRKNKPKYEAKKYKKDITTNIYELARKTNKQENGINFFFFLQIEVDKNPSRRQRAWSRFDTRWARPTDFPVCASTDKQTCFDDTQFGKNSLFEK